MIRDVCLSCDELMDITLLLGVDLDGSPYFFSTLNNKFVFNGCGNAVITADNGSVVTGCSTTCRNDTLSDTNNCFGISCCEKTGIPHYLQSYRINLTNLDGEDGGCGSAFLADKTTYGQQRFSDPSFLTANLDY
ncbi:putative wall-associated receptor kinase [Helianthus annuus]|nr:putative wall-associated receptor kinase [Helianthus annuus]KAJ0877137.1 putative wall-associated receptor kinase [Helianthus annuus]